MKDIISVRRYDSPCGPLTLGSSGDRLCLCDWRCAKNSDRAVRSLESALNAVVEERQSAVLDRVASLLDRYFSGERVVFDVPLLFVGTDFQKIVWKELFGIPYGTTISYAALSGRIGRPEAVRAVANAVGANVMSIFVPCHRIVGSDGSLTGYRGGKAAKQKLLDLELLSTEAVRPLGV